MKLLIINGPNLNLLGTREPDIYGDREFKDFLEHLKSSNSDHALDYFQSNVEGEIINKLQEAEAQYNGIILNAGGYTHTSVAIADTIAAITTPVVEVHISNIMAREVERRTSLISRNCIGIISGFGLDSYSLAVDYFLNYTTS